MKAAAFLLCAGALISFAATAEPLRVPNFRLKDTGGAIHELYSHAESKAVVLFAQMNGCPIVRQSYPYLEELRARFESQGVVFLYINSHPWDTNEDIAAECRDYSATAPVLRDMHRALAYALEFKRSAEVFVVDPRTWTVVFRGMADDRFDYGLQRMSPNKFWLRDVLAGMVEGREVSVESTIAKGCLLDLDFSSKPVFSRDVAPILSARFPGRFPEKLDQRAAMLQSQALLDAVLTDRSAGRELHLSDADAETISAWLFSPYEAEIPAPSK